MKRETCHDCGVIEGQIHEFNCDCERCPFCGNQLLTCGCCYRNLGFDYKPGIEEINGEWVQEHPTNGLPEDIYFNGLSDELTEKWRGILKEKGRVPFIKYPNLCRKCGVKWPDMFNVPDEDWEKYVNITKRDQMLCRSCYDQIKEWIDSEEKVKE